MLNVYPVIWRELKVDLFNFSKFTNYFLSSVFLLILFGLVFSININLIPFHGHQIKFSHFFIPGVLALQIFLLFSKTFSMIRIDNNNNLIPSILISKTSIYSYFIGKLIANILLTFIRIILLIIIGWLIFGLPVPLHLVQVINLTLAILTGCCIWFSIGFVCGIFIVKEDRRDLILSVVSMPISFASSVYYNIDSAPEFIRTLARFNPLTYNCNLLRESILNIGTSTTSDILILFAISLIMTIAANVSLKYFTN